MQVRPDPSLPSPVENLRWLEDQLDVTYSPVCCSYNAGTTTLLLRLPNAACEDGGKCCTGGLRPAPSVGVLGWEREGCNEQNVVDIFGRIQDIETLQAKRESSYWSAADNGLLDLKLAQGQQSYVLPSEPVGSLAQIEEIVDSCTEDSASTPQRSEVLLSSSAFKQSEEAGGLRSFINNCLMLPGTRKLSGGRKEKSRADAGVLLKERTDASSGRGLQFLQWRGRFPKAASSGSSSIEEGESRSPACAESDKINAGGCRNQQQDAGMAKEKLRQAGRLLSRRRNKNEPSDGGLANVASPLPVPSLG